MLHGDQNGLAEHLPAFNTLLCSQNGLETVLPKLYKYSTGFPALKRPCQSLTSLQQALLNSEQTCPTPTSCRLAEPTQASNTLGGSQDGPAKPPEAFNRHRRCQKDRTNTRNGSGNGLKNGLIKLKICSPSGQWKSFHCHGLT